MYPALFTVVTTVLIAALYAELRDIFGATQKNAQERQRVSILNRRSGR